MFIDTHTHLYHQRFDADRAEMVNRAIESGVKRLYLPNIDRDSIEGMHTMAEQWPDVCFPMMGLHPCHVEKDSFVLLGEMRELLNTGRYCAVGEIGIDLYWEKSLLREQQEAFRTQVNWAKELELPIVIHCRDSFNEVFEIVQEENSDKLTGVFHCFTGSLEEAQKVIALKGFYLGIGGVATFKNGGLDQVIPDLGLDHVVLETDAPFLAPAPHRGKRNESAYVPMVAARVAEFTGKSIDDVADITTANALKLFKHG